jgi:hypothetical protein
MCISGSGTLGKGGGAVGWVVQMHVEGSADVRTVLREEGAGEEGHDLPLLVVGGLEAVRHRRASLAPGGPEGVAQQRHGGAKRLCAARVHLAVAAEEHGLGEGLGGGGRCEVRTYLATRSGQPSWSPLGLLAGLTCAVLMAKMQSLL